MKLVVGLGNIGVRYQNTRHNAGFLVLDAIAKKYGLTFLSKPEAYLAEWQYNGEKVLLCKPKTYMNLSGNAVLPLMQFYKLQPEQLLVVQDDVDSAFGTLKLKKGGRSGGQRGVQHIIEVLNTEAFSRLKLGISRPPKGWQVPDWVLSQFTATEEPMLKELIALSVNATEVWVSAGLLAAQQQFNHTDLRPKEEVVEEVPSENQDVRNDPSI